MSSVSQWWPSNRRQQQVTGFICRSRAYANRPGPLPVARRPVWCTIYSSGVALGDALSSIFTGYNWFPVHPFPYTIRQHVLLLSLFSASYSQLTQQNSITSLQCWQHLMGLVTSDRGLVPLTIPAGLVCVVFTTHKMHLRNKPTSPWQWRKILLLQWPNVTNSSNKSVTLTLMSPASWRRVWNFSNMAQTYTQNW